MVQRGIAKKRAFETAYRQVLFLFIISLVIAVCVLPAQAAPGDLDTTFDTDGVVTTRVGAGDDMVFGVAVQTDGKIVVAGRSNNGADNDFMVVRYNSDGSLDTSFGGDGIVTTAIGAGDDNGYHLAIQTDGKIVVAGRSNNGADHDIAVVRYSSDGSLDTSFDGDGIATTAIGADHDRAWGVALQSDGKIVVVGYSFNGLDDDVAVVRYNSNGSLDTSFSGDGIVTTAIGGGLDQGYKVAIQSDGKIVVAAETDNGSDNDFAVIRYNSDGSLDTSFNADGIATLDISGLNDRGRAVAVQPDGKIILAGYSHNGTDDDFAVVRYNSDGSLDTTFNRNGIVHTAIGSYRDFCWSVVLQPDGKIILAGDSEYGAYSDFAVVRYNRDGSLDTTFGTDGMVTTPIGIADDVGRAMAIQPDGNIVVAGYYNANATDSDIAVVRYSGDATPTVTTSEVSSITQTSAVCGGQVAGDGSTAIPVIANADVTARGVCWGTSTEPTIEDNITEDGTGTGAFTSEITGLTGGTIYYVRAYAANWVGTAYGEERTFTTPGDDTGGGGDGGGGGGGGGGGCFLHDITSGSH